MKKQIETLSAVLIKASLVTSLVFLVSCGTSGKKDASSLGAIVGTSLSGTKGATPQDQTNIDTTVARLCGSDVWNKATCAHHNTYRNR